MLIQNRCVISGKTLPSKTNPKHSRTLLQQTITKPPPPKLAKTAKKSTYSSEMVVQSLAEKNNLIVFKDIREAQINGHYKFVGLVFNDSCNLRVNDADLLRFPRNLTSESVHDMKDIKMCKDLVECRHQVECTREMLAHHQNMKLAALIKQIDELCKESKNTCTDKDLSNALDDLQYSRRAYKQLECKLIDVKKQNSEEQYRLDCNHKNALDEVKKERDELENMLRKQIIYYETKCDKETKTTIERESIIELRNLEIKSLRMSIVELSSTVKQLTYSLEHSEDQLRFSRRNERMKSETINSLLDQLRQAYHHLTKLRYTSSLKKFSFDDKDHIIVALQIQVSELKSKNRLLEGDLKQFKLTQEENKDLSMAHKQATAEIEMLKAKLAKQSKLPSNTFHIDPEDLKQELLKSKEKISNLKRILNHGHANQ